MGGIFSGRKPAPTTKPYPEHFISLDVRKLQRDQLLEPGQAYNLHQYEYRFGRKRGIFSISTRKDFLELGYSSCNPKDDCFPPQNVQIAWTLCHFGGYRPWFLCPKDKCGRRVAILYGPQPMLCRLCWRIAYESQRENKIQRLRRRLRSIESFCYRSSGAQAGTRPKGMHYRTFQRLEKEHKRLLDQINRLEIEELIKLEQSIPDWM